MELTPTTIIRQPYYANLGGTNSGQRWTDRTPNARVRDIFYNRIPDTPMNISLNTRLTQLQRIRAGIDNGMLLGVNQIHLIVSDYKPIY